MEEPEKDILDSYFKIECPYLPEFLFKKVKDELENYDYTLIKELKNQIKKDIFNKIFVPIFGIDSYKFNYKVTDAKSIDNFKNLDYE